MKSEELWWTSSRYSKNSIPQIRRIDSEHDRTGTYDSDDRIGNMNHEERIAPVPSADDCKKLHNRKAVVVNREALLYILNNISQIDPPCTHKFFETVQLLLRTVE